MFRIPMATYGVQRAARNAVAVRLAAALLPAAHVAARFMPAAVLVALGTPVRALAAAAGAPQLLSQTGLYAGPGDLQIAAANLAFAPQYPLWSDGAHKSRWIYVPRGRKIDTRRVDAWEFPAGTKFWKEFVFNGHKVETRFLWKVNDSDWVAASYVWRADQTDAELAPEDGLADVVEIAPGKQHSIPGVNDCRACHESDHFAPLGFNALQLSTDRDPNALHAEPPAPGMATLQTLADLQLLEPARPELLANPPRIAAVTPRTRAVLGYFTSNCGSCHNAQNLAAVGLYLRQSVADGPSGPQAVLRSAVGVASRYAMPGETPGGTLRIAPGAPDRSAVAYRMASRRPLSQMPPLGTVVVDDEAVALVRRWIAEDLALQPASPTPPANPGGQPRPPSATLPRSRRPQGALEPDRAFHILQGDARGARDVGTG